jgi:hypothetical protein
VGYLLLESKAIAIPIVFAKNRYAQRVRNRKGNYLVPLLDALSGLIFEFFPVDSATIFVARLHFPFFHFKDGSGQAVQYQSEEYSLLRLQPEHWSIISWQIPPL